MKTKLIPTKLTEQQKYFLDRLPRKWDLNGQEDMA
jgi:hypothetical protein